MSLRCVDWNYAAPESTICNLMQICPARCNARHSYLAQKHIFETFYFPIVDVQTHPCVRAYGNQSLPTNPQTNRRHVVHRCLRESWQGKKQKAQPWKFKLCSSQMTHKHTRCDCCCDDTDLNKQSRSKGEEYSRDFLKCSLIKAEIRLCAGCFCCV